MLVREPPHTCGERELLERRDVLRDDAKRKRDRAPLPERVDAEAREVLVLVRDVEVARVVEAVALVRRDLGDLVEDERELLLAEHRQVVHRAERAVAAKDRRLADLQMDVACAELDGALEGGVQVHGAVAACIGSGRRRL